MAELNEVFIFNKDLHIMLPIEEGRLSIYGVRPSYMFNPNDHIGNGSQNSRIFQRDTYQSHHSRRQPIARDTHSGQEETRTKTQTETRDEYESMKTSMTSFLQGTKENASYIGQKLGVF